MLPSRCKTLVPKKKVTAPLTRKQLKKKMFGTTHVPPTIIPGSTAPAATAAITATTATTTTTTRGGPDNGPDPSIFHPTYNGDQAAPI